MVGAEAGHLDPLLARRVLGGDGGAGEGGGRRRRAAGFGRGGDGAGHVFLHHAAVAAGALDLIAGEAGLGHRLLGGGRVFHVLAGGCRRGAGAGAGAGSALGAAAGAGGGACAFGHDGEAARWRRPSCLRRR